MSNTFNKNNCFGANKEPLGAGDYIQKKKARSTYCKSNICINQNTGTYENYNLLHTAQQLDTYNCYLPFNKYDLNRNLFTKLDTSGLCVLRDASNNVCTTRIDPSLNIFDSYIIDPSGFLFGNSVCGLNNYVNLMTKISYAVTGNYDISSNSIYNTIIIFKGNGTFTLKSGILNSDILSVGGGGGGGSGTIGSGPGGGGAGGGGIIENLTSIVTNTFYIITVGTGGTGGSNLNAGQPGTNGGNSSFIGSSTSIVANGGKGGQANYTGGASGTPGSTGGTYTPTPLSNGGNGTIGGGGGAAAYLGNGGNGSVNITTTNYGTTFGAGGGGGGGNGGSIGGAAGNSNAGVGGNGPTNTFAGNGVANTGGGGGGGSSGTNNSYIGGGNGGSGVVILSFNV